MEVPPPIEDDVDVDAVLVALVLVETEVEVDVSDALHARNPEAALIGKLAMTMRWKVVASDRA
jgi:hypothetical protein